MEDITVADYAQAKIVCKYFEIKVYCQLIYLKTLKICVWKYINLTLSKFFQLLDYHGKQLLKKTKVKLDLLTDTDMSLMVEKGIRVGICHSVY